MTTMTTIKLAERFGPVLAGRIEAVALGQELAKEAARSPEPIVIDLAEVTTISPSFADELFGKLPASVGRGTVVFENLDPHLVDVAAVARNGRLAVTRERPV